MDSAMKEDRCINMAILWHSFSEMELQEELLIELEQLADEVPENGV